MIYDNKLYIGKSGEEKIVIYPSMANRHGMIAGATGTGKTVTLKVIAESFSDMGVPVFMADVKGDLSGMCIGGSNTENIQKRVEKLGLNEEGFSFTAYPVNFWDVYEKQGMPLRTTISEMGPLLLSKILGLNDTQSAILKVVFKIADDEGLLLIDTKDLRSMLTYVSGKSKEYSVSYGNMAPQSLAAIIRAVIALEDEGGNLFFGEPALDIKDWMACSYDGKGYINLLDCQELVNRPIMYSAFLLWMLSELYEMMPEAGDMDKPKLVFFFDEAHLLFDSASKDLLEKVEQIVKLIRSKGVSIFFITQNPKDIPDGVLSQLGTKVQHALRAYTPAEQKGAKIAAQSFRVNPEFDTYETLSNLGIGEALVSVLDEEGIPTIVKKTKILPPRSKMGAVDFETRSKHMAVSPLYNKYAEAYDRDSAYEFLMRKAQADEEAKEYAKAEAEREKLEALEEKRREKEISDRLKELEKEKARIRKEIEKRDAAQLRAREKEAERQSRAVKNAVKSVSSSAAGTVGREVGKTVGSSFGSFGKKLGGNVGSSLGRGIIGTLFGK